MRRQLTVGTVLVIAIFATFCPQACAQQIGTIAGAFQNTWDKAENGMVLSWHRGISVDEDSSRINIYDLQGNALSSFSVLSLVPEAESVSIDDVSAQKDRLVALVAVYVRRQDHSPAAVLLYLDFTGRLVTALALAPSREAVAVVLDDDLHAWTLTHSAADEDPGHSPLVVEYSSAGQVMKELLTRDSFPPHEHSIRENSQVGSAAVGYQTGIFWFWLPDSTDLVAIRASDGIVISRIRPGIPNIAAKRIWPLQIVRQSSGEIVGEFHVGDLEPKPKSKGSLGYFAWSPQTKSWSPFSPEPCASHRLIGTDGGKQIYLSLNTNPVTICSYSRL